MRIFKGAGATYTNVVLNLSLQFYLRSIASCHKRLFLLLFLFVTKRLNQENEEGKLFLRKSSFT